MRYYYINSERIFLWNKNIDDILSLDIESILSSAIFSAKIVWFARSKGMIFIFKRILNVSIIVGLFIHPLHTISGTVPFYIYVCTYHI